MKAPNRVVMIVSASAPTFEELMKKLDEAKDTALEASGGHQYQPISSSGPAMVAFGGQLHASMSIVANDLYH